MDIRGELSKFIYNLTFLAFTIVNDLIISSKSNFFAIACSIDNIARPSILSCVIVERIYVLINFTLEKLLSAVATDAGRVKSILRETNKFPKAAFKLFEQIKSKIFLGD